MHLPEDLTVEHIEAFVQALRDEALIQSLEWEQNNVPVEQRDFDRDLLKEIFVHYGFDQRSNWLDVDFNEPDPLLLLGQLERADLEHLQTIKMILQRQADPRQPVDFDQLVEELGFKPEDFHL